MWNMLRIWCLLVAIVSSIELVSSKDINVCNVIGETKSNLSNVVVIFAKIIEVEVVVEHVAAIASSANVELFDEFPGVMEQFYQCYGAKGGLKVVRTAFRKENGTCSMVEPRKAGNFSSKRVKLIMSGSLAVSCGQNNVSSFLRNIFSLDPSTETAEVVNLNSPWFYSLRSNRSKNQTLKVSEDSRIYEHLEWKVDQLDPNSQKPTHFDQKYTYFMSVPKLQKALWPSIAAVCLVILFFFIGLLMCCCSLLLYALVEEDFRKRNEEREWLAAQLRRRDYIETLPRALPPPRTPISRSDTMNTALSVDDRISGASISSSSGDVHTDRTQLSETISGTPSLSETQKGSQLETQKTQSTMSELN